MSSTKTFISKYIFCFILVGLSLKLVLELTKIEEPKETIRNSISKARLQKEALSTEAEFKVLVQYVHPIETKNEIIMENFRYFLTIGVLPCHSNADFRIILITKSENTNVYEKLGPLLNDTDLVQDLKRCKNVNFLLSQNSEGLCAHSIQFKRSEWIREKLKYKYFFFIDSTLRGPFLPNYWAQPW